MRKDVKLGFAIGGVLLAVLIVYVLVVPGGGDKRVASATGGASQSGGGGGAGVSLEPVAPTTPATQPNGTGATAGAAGTPPPAAPATFTPPAGGTDPFEQPDPAVASNVSNGKPKDTTNVDWSKLLNDSQMLMVQTPSKPVVSAAPPPSASNESKPTEVAIGGGGGGAADITKPGPTPVTPPPAPTTPAPTSEQPSPPTATETAQANNHSSDAGNTNVIVDPPTPGSVTAPVATDTTSASGGGQKIHVVQAGESFSTISMIAYGNANLYAAIMRANPGVDPVKLRPGMKINIPPASEAMPAKAPTPAAAPGPTATPPAPRIVPGENAQTAKAEQPVDAQTQYRVQPGDNLYSISKKLYGRGDRYQRIHEANKQALGDDANTLKAGMVLTLPEPPTAK